MGYIFEKLTVITIVAILAYTHGVLVYFLRNVPIYLKRIAEGLHKGNSGYAQGYSMGYIDGKRYAEVKRRWTHDGT